MRVVCASFLVIICLAGCGGSEQYEKANATTQVTPPVAPQETKQVTLQVAPLDTAPAQEMTPVLPVLLGAEVVRSGDLHPGLPIRFDHPELPRLIELQTRENLGLVMDNPSAANNGNAEFQGILRLKNWVATQWPHTLPAPYPPWDAIVVLDWIRSGRTGGNCGQYSQVLLQALNSFGIAARYVEIGSIDNPYAHFVVEVWSNEFDKWVVMDADFNVHFERNGIPQSALELHDALLGGKTDEIVDVLGSYRVGHDYPNRFPLRTIELYYYLRVLLNANHLSAPDEPPFDRMNDMVEWNDDVSVPWEQSTVISPYRHVRLTNQTNRDRDQFNAKLDQVEITIESVENGNVHLRFETNHPWLRHYQVKEVYRNAGFVRQVQELDSASTFVWTPITPNYYLEVRAVGPYARSGPPAIVEARFDLQQ